MIYKKEYDSRLFRFAILIVLLLGLLNGISAQEDSMVPKVKRNDFKNVVKFNLSSRLLYDNAFILGYERVIKKNQTLNITGGYMEFPITLEMSEVFELREQRKKSGYNVVLDWRFYLANENKHPVPHGLYLAPFVAFHHFKSSRDFTYTDTAGTIKDATMNNKISFFTIGGQMGYQFVIKRRFVVDAVLFGPGFTSYHFDVKLDGNLNAIDEETVAGKIIEALRDKIPLLDEISSGGSVSGSGVQTFWSVGFRYSISLGYRF